MRLIAPVLGMFAIVLGILLLPTPALASRAELNLVACHGSSRPNFPDRVYIVEYVIIETDRAPDVVTARWKRDAPAMGVYPYDCNVYADRQAVRSKMLSFAQNAAAQKNRDVRGNVYSSEWSVANQERPWSPKFEDASISSSKQIKAVSFRNPRNDERGFAGLTFDIEYQFISCMGELHLAYSLVENSLKSGRLSGGGKELVIGVASDTANYWYNGQVYKVKMPTKAELSLPLKGAVWIEPYHSTPIGRFADDHASEALGFGCFTGQTAKIASLKELKTDTDKEPTKEELAKLFDRLRVSFETSRVHTSAAAEEEIEFGLAEKASIERERTGQAGLDAAAEERARRKAEREAEFQAKQAKYEQDVAAQQKATADYEAAQKQIEFDKTAAAANARAAQEAFAQKQAAHQAELERYARERAEYEAKVAGQASVNMPKN